MKIKDKVISIRNCIMDVYDPNCFLNTYAQLEEGMEGYVEEILTMDEVIVNFHGVSIIIETEEFAQGEFMLERELTGLKLVVMEEEKEKLN